jgi:hypothetical protein
VAVNALDTGAAVPAPSPYLLLSGKVVPGWAVRLLVLALIAPVLAVAIDALARARRRGYSILRWVLWVLTAAVPFLLGFALVLIARVTGWLAATPPGPVAAHGVPLTAAGIAALASVAFIIIVAFVGLRPLLARLARRIGSSGASEPPGDGAAIALVLVSCCTALIVWVFNPFAAALVVPGLHLWLWLTHPRIRSSKLAHGALTLAALIPPVLLVAYYARSLGLPPVGVAWNGLLLFAGGHLGPLPAVYWSVLLGCVASAVAIAVRAAPSRPSEEPAITIRGPVTYAGPGSLGGIKSALRK